MDGWISQSKHDFYFWIKVWCATSLEVLMGVKDHFIYPNIVVRCVDRQIESRPAIFVGHSRTDLNPLLHDRMILVLTALVGILLVEQRKPNPLTWNTKCLVEDMTANEIGHSSCCLSFSPFFSLSI